MMHRSLLAFFFFITSSAVLWGDESDPIRILERVDAAYHDLKTYRSNGKVVMNMEYDGQKVYLETDFYLRLKKPNAYLISWEGNVPVKQTGAVWNAGEQAFLFMSALNAYGKFEQDEIALAAATGISGGAAHTIPALFFKATHDHGKPFERLQQPVLEGKEVIEGIECYVISSPSALSRKETLWISTENYLLVQISRSLEAPGGQSRVPALSDREVDQALEAMGLALTDANRERTRRMMREAAEQFSNVQLKGTTTELHRNISYPDLESTDFIFELPEGATEKESLFEGLPGF